MSYSSEEIQAVVEKLVRSSIRRPLDTLGVRRTDLSFTDVQEAAAGVFLLYSNAPFYVISLGCARVLGDVITLDMIMSRLVGAVRATGRNVLPVDDVSPLFNARAALRELAGAASSRTEGFRDITKLPAHVRFEDNVNRFLEGAGTNVKEEGEIAETPQEARSVIPGLIRELAEVHGNLITSVKGLANGMVDYESVNLPRLVASGVLSRSAELLTETTDFLEPLDREARLGKLKEAVLNLLATKAVVRTFGSFSPPSDVYPLEGTGMAFTDAQHPATPAKFSATLGGAYSILEGVNDQLVLTMNGAPAETITLAPSFVAFLEGTTEEENNTGRGFRIGDGVLPSPPGGSPLHNNMLKLRVGAFDHNAFINTSSTTYDELIPIETIARDLDLALPTDVVAEPAFTILKLDGLLDIDAGGPTTTMRRTGGLGAGFDELGIGAGDAVWIDGGPNDGFYNVVSSTATELVVDAGSALAFVAESGAHVTVGPRLRRLRIRLEPLAGFVENEEELQILGDSPAAKGFCDTLGFFPGQFSKSRRTSLRDLVEDINSKTSSAIAGRDYATLFSAMPARASLGDRRQVTFAHTSGTGNAVFSGTTLTFTMVSLLGSRRPPRLGQLLVLRSGPDADKGWEITAINGDVLVATGSAGTSAIGVSFEVGPRGLHLESYDTLRILGGPNAGDYTVAEELATPIDAAVLPTLPVVRDGAREAQFEAELGQQYLTLRSKDTTFNSSIRVSGSAAALFAGPLGVEPGRTTWFRLPAIPRGLQVGDTLDLFATYYSSATRSISITSIDTTLRVIGLAEEVSVLSVWSFGDIPVPKAQLRHKKMADFGDLRAQLLRWLTYEGNQPSFFINLSRFVNPLLVSKNPTEAQVSAVVNHLFLLYQRLTAGAARAVLLDPTSSLEAMLLSYRVAPEPEVDALLRSYKEKGADRAIDLLLGGYFSTFFSLSAEESSYSGALQHAMREVAREDVPVRKTERTDVTRPRTITEYESTDPEFDTSDTEDMGKPENL